VAAADLALIFAVDGVANPVESILDAPMAAPTGEKFGGVGAVARDTGDGELHFDGGLAVADGGPFQATDLSQARPIEMRCESRTGLKMPPCAATVAFVAGVSFRQRALPLGLARRGKNRAGTRPRWLPSIRVDYL